MPLILRRLLEQLIHLARRNPVLLSQEFDRLATRANTIIGHFAKFMEERCQLRDRSLVFFGRFGRRHDDRELPLGGHHLHDVQVGPGEALEDGVVDPRCPHGRG